MEKLTERQKWEIVKKSICKAVEYGPHSVNDEVNYYYGVIESLYELITWEPKN